MHVDTIPAAVLDAGTSLFSPYVHGLTATRHVAALQAFEPDSDGRKIAAPPARMLSLEQAAEVLAVSVCTARRMVKDGRLAGRKVGGQWRVPFAAIATLANTEMV